MVTPAMKLAAREMMALLTEGYRLCQPETVGASMPHSSE
jgi:hypothetical protein